MNDLPTSAERRHDLDWLRVIAFGALVYFHAAVAFLPDGLPLIRNDVPSPVLHAAVAFLHQFRLPLLFFVAGAGSYFALRRRGGRAWLRERALRLLLPLSVGVLFVVPPMVWLEKRHIGELSDGFLAFYPSVFTSGTYPSGNLSWHHYWFVAYLFLHSLLLYALVALARRSHPFATAARALGRTLERGAGLYAPIAALWLVEATLRPSFPGFRDLVHDWTDFTIWFLVLAAGYLFASRPRLLERAATLRRHSLALAVLASALYFSWRAEPAFAEFHHAAQSGADPVRWLALALARAANLWCWTLVCVGYAGRYLNRPNRALAWLNGAVYPLFCLHLTVLVAVEYLVVPRDWPIALEYATITTVTLVVCLAAYQLVLRRSRGLAPLFGARAVDGARRFPHRSGRSVGVAGGGARTGTPEKIAPTSSPARARSVARGPGVAGASPSAPPRARGASAGPSRPSGRDTADPDARLHGLPRGRILTNGSSGSPTSRAGEPVHRRRWP